MSTGRGVGVGTKTVLFSDVVDSTQLRAALGEHQADALDSELRRLHETGVEGNDGELVKGLGDGWMAVFDGAANAIGAAIELQSRLRDRNRRRDVDVGLRIGLSTGDVSITGDDYLGTPVVEAARLCGAAESGEILIAEVVRLLAGSRAGGQLLDHGTLDLKGLAAPVQTWKVVWDSVAAKRPTVPAGLAIHDEFAFVGRRREQERMEAAWTRAVDGHATVLLVAGEPGAGKTRLTAEFARTAQAAGALIVYGSCEDGLAVPYQPFVEALRQVLAAAARPNLGSHPEELTRIVPEISDRVPGLSEPTSSDPETERYQLFNAIVDWLVALAAEDPVVFVLDDLHWATRPTLHLLQHVVRSNPQARVLILATFRDTDIDAEHPLREALADLQRSDNVERISLGGLDVESVRDYIAAARRSPARSARRRSCRTAPRGDERQPFLHARGAPALGRGWPLVPRGRPVDSRQRVPHRGSGGSARCDLSPARDACRNRLARCCHAAAVIGTDFGLRVLEDVTGFDEETVFDGLEQAMGARLLEEVELDRYRFTHALVRAALLDGLSASRRARIHRQVAETLERSTAKHLDLVEDLAEHWAAAGNAGDASKALTYTRLAAQRASDQLAYDEAAALLRRALQCVVDSGMGERQRAEVLAELGAAQQRAGDPDHRTTLLEAGRLALRLGAADLLVRSVLDNARTAAVLDVDDERVDLLEAALASTASDRRLGPRSPAREPQLRALLHARSRTCGRAQRRSIAARTSMRFAGGSGVRLVDARHRIPESRRAELSASKSAPSSRRSVSSSTIPACGSTPRFAAPRCSWMRATSTASAGWWTPWRY